MKTIINYWEAPVYFDKLDTTDKVSMASKIKRYHVEAFEKLEKHLKPRVSEKALRDYRATYKLINLELCTRLKTTGGTATTNINTGSAKIKLNYRLFASTNTTDDDMKNTYLHELAHVLANRLFGKSQGHNANWRNMARIIGCNGERCHDMKIPLELSAKKYTVLCPMCDNPHMVTKRKYLTIKENPNRFQCKTHKQGIIAGKLLN